MIDYTRAYSGGSQRSIDQGLRTYMLRVYNLMAVALFITAAAATIAFSFDPVAKLLFTFSPSGNYITGQTPLGILVNLAPIGIVLYLSMGISRIEISTAQILFWVYAVFVGLSLSSLGYLYTGESIASTFFISASVFAAMSIYGHTTQRDLTSMGSIMLMGLFGILLASIVNIFIGSAAITFAISVLGVVIFMGLIAWDTQKLKNIYYYSTGGGESGQRYAIIGALHLYLDLINLFLHLLRFTGNRRQQ